MQGARSRARREQHGLRRGRRPPGPRKTRQEPGSPGRGGRDGGPGGPRLVRPPPPPATSFPAGPARGPAGRHRGPSRRGDTRGGPCDGRSGRQRPGGQSRRRPEARPQPRPHEPGPRALAAARPRESEPCTPPRCRSLRAPGGGTLRGAGRAGGGGWRPAGTLARRRPRAPAGAGGARGPQRLAAKEKPGHATHTSLRFMRRKKSPKPRGPAATGADHREEGAEGQLPGDGRGGGLSCRAPAGPWPTACVGS